MSDFIRRLLRGSLPRGTARSADEAAAYLKKLGWDEKMAADQAMLDAFYGRTPANPVPDVIEVPPTGAEQLAAAGIPMPSFARRLVNAAEADLYPGPDAAALRSWLDTQAPEPRAIPRGSQQTALDTIRDSFDTMLRGRVDASAAAQRRPVEVLQGVGRGAVDLASGLAGAAGSAGRGVAGVVQGMGPLPLAAVGTGTALAIAATRQARMQKDAIAAAAEEVRREEADRASSAENEAAADLLPASAPSDGKFEPLNNIDGFDPVATDVQDAEGPGFDPMLLQIGDRPDVMEATAPAAMRDGRPVPNSALHYRQLQADAASGLGPEPLDGIETESQARARFDSKYGAGEWDKAQARKAPPPSRVRARPAPSMALPPRRSRPLDAGE